MGIIRKAFYTSILGTTGAIAYLASDSNINSPLPKSDPIWNSKLYKRHNPNKNAPTQDVCTKRIPLSKIRPELLQQKDGLVLEFCRGVWSGIGYEVQRRYLENKYRGPETESQLWTREDLSNSTYEYGTRITDHFEVVEKRPNAITVRCGDSPRNKNFRPSDGLFEISANVDKADEVVVLRLKSLLFPSEGITSSENGPMPWFMEELHQWYARIWMSTASRRLLA